MQQQPSITYGRNTAYSIDEPQKYDVIMHNDDITTMDFVVSVLMTIFKKAKEDATRLMMKIHKEGKAVVGTYYYDIAISKTQMATAMARREGFPLNITVSKHG